MHFVTSPGYKAQIPPPKKTGKVKQRIKSGFLTKDISGIDYVYNKEIRLQNELNKSKLKTEWLIFMPQFWCDGLLGDVANRMQAPIHSPFHSLTMWLDSWNVECAEDAPCQAGRKALTEGVGLWSSWNDRFHNTFTPSDRGHFQRRGRSVGLLNTLFVVPLTG